MRRLRKVDVVALVRAAVDNDPVLPQAMRDAIVQRAATMQVRAKR